MPKYIQNVINNTEVNLKKKTNQLLKITVKRFKKIFHGHVDLRKGPFNK